MPVRHSNDAIASRARQKRERDCGVRGFALSEMMVVIALLVIMGLIAALFSSQLVHSITMMQRNACAQQIYDVTQSRLSILQSQGRLAKLEKTISSDGGKVDSQPQDWAEKESIAEATWQSDYGLYHTNVFNSAAVISTGGDAVALLLEARDFSSLISSDISNGYYTIELSPMTAEVYAVWYWESDAEIGGTEGAHLSYDEVASLRNIGSTSDYASDFIVACSDATVGYYGGNPIDPEIAALPSIDISDASLALVNGEELYAHIGGLTIDKDAFTNNPDVLKDGNFLVSMNVEDAVTGKLRSFNFDYAEFVSGASTNGQVKFVCDDTMLMPGNRYACSVDIILDSMREDMGFQKLVNESGTGDDPITLGDDVIVTASLRYGDTKKVGIDDTANSLFADSSLYKGKPASSLTDDASINYEATDKIEVAYVRHLNNLRNITETEYTPKSGNAFTIEQTKDLDFVGKPVTSTANGVTTYDWGSGNWGIATVSDGILTAEYPSVSQQTIDLAKTRGGGEQNNLNFLNVPASSMDAAAYMEPIQSALVNSYEGVTYSAKTGATEANANASYKLSNLSIRRGASADNTALFANMANKAKIEYVDVVNSSVASTNDYCATLVGRAMGTIDVDRCTVSGNASVSGKAYVGGLIGKSEYKCEITNCSVGTSAQAANIISTASDSDSRTGGIIGQPVSSEGDPCVVDNCSFYGSVKAAGNYVGGIAGTSYSTTFTRCTVSTAGDGISGAYYVGGLVGGSYGNTTVGGVSDKACFVAGSVLATTTAAGGAIGFAGDRITLSYCSVGSTASGISVSSSGDCSGGLVGNLYCSNGSISNSNVYGRVGGKSGVGGVVGWQPDQNAGSAPSCNITNCSVGDEDHFATVSMTSEYGWYTGGIIGFKGESGLVSNCTVFANVDGYNYVGGVAGDVVKGSFSDCGIRGKTGRADGAVTVSTAAHNVGGFAGYLQAGVSVERCYAAAKVDANIWWSENTGGFVGETHASIKDSYAASTKYDGLTVTGWKNVGGFAGYTAADATITNCYSTCNAKAAGENGSSFIGLCQTSTNSIMNNTAYGVYAAGTEAITCCGFVGNHFSVDASNRYLAPANATDNGHGGTSSNYNSLKVSSNSGASAAPYTSSLGTTFPFKLVTSVHYGDWPEAPAEPSGLRDIIPTAYYYLDPQYTWDQFVDDFYIDTNDGYGFLSRPEGTMIIVGNSIYATTSLNSFGGGMQLNKDAYKALINSVTGEVDSRLLTPQGDANQPFLVKLDIDGFVYDWTIEGANWALPAGTLVYSLNGDGKLRYVYGDGDTGSNFEISSDQYTRVVAPITNADALAKGDSITVTYDDGSTGTIQTVYSFAEACQNGMANTAGTVVKDASGNLYIRNQNYSTLPEYAAYTSPESWITAEYDWQTPYFSKVSTTGWKKATGEFTVNKGDVVYKDGALYYVTADGGNKYYFASVQFNTDSYTYN